MESSKLRQNALHTNEVIEILVREETMFCNFRMNEMSIAMEV